MKSKNLLWPFSSVSLFSWQAILATGVLVMFSSCQSPLITATEQGNVEAVRQALAEDGTKNAKLLEKAAAIAYTKGNDEILNELAKAGAAVAPASVGGKVLILEETGTADETIDSSTGWDALEEMEDENNTTCFSKYWVDNISYDRPSEHTVTSIKWTEPNVVTATKENKDGSGEGDTKIYKRLNVNLVELTHRYWLLADPMGTIDYGRDKYRLMFTTPTSGKYLQITTQKGGYVGQSIGNFCLKDMPTTSKAKRK